MAGKISEMSAASALDGSEQLEVVQGGVNKKVTVNDLLPVQLQGDKEIDLDGHDFRIGDGLTDILKITRTPTNEEIFIGSSDAVGYGQGYFISSSDQTFYGFYFQGFDGAKSVEIEANAVEGSIEYTADNHIFPDLVAKDFANDGAAATGLVPVGGLYHTSGTLKIRLA